MDANKSSVVLNRQKRISEMFYFDANTGIDICESFSEESSFVDNND